MDSKLALMAAPEGDNRTIQEKYNNAKTNLDSLLKGERAAYYTKKLAFLMTRAVNSNFLDSDIEIYAKARGLDYNQMSTETKEKL
ncbi:MAG: hypothetical protein Nk1A_7890 [Endomicrobiia bacterium]|nr:MAG: hypothetical protein Nk1A_7890 [Endomicrobiia bacterium]